MPDRDTMFTNSIQTVGALSNPQARAKAARSEA